MSNIITIGSWPLTIGELIAELQNRPFDNRVSIPLERGTLSGECFSYRGYYDQLAIGVAECPNEFTVGGLLVMLEGAVGKTFEGYKGGDFTMDSDTPVWVAHGRGAVGAGIAGVHDTRYTTVLILSEY